MSTIHTHRFSNRGISFEEFTSNEDIRVLAFEYIIPRPLFYPIRRITRLYLIRPGESPIKLSWGYSLFSFLFGWLGLPFGPIFTFNTISSNFKGNDFTLDFRENINAGDFAMGRLTLTKVAKEFMPPRRGEQKEMKKAFRRYTKTVKAFDRPAVVAVQISQEDTPYVIGLADSDYQHCEELKQCLYKYFYKFAQFEFINLDYAHGEYEERVKKLIDQGKTLPI